ncbi:MAG: molybdopterin synthase sulfur carrier subunit [Caulobacteraceae bacterium]|nr:molybdopterin synthase sulfur carrier subunit [Caulobacteraceae bacterium]
MRVLLFGRLADQAGWREREAPALESVEAAACFAADGDEALLAALTASTTQVAVDQVLWRSGELPPQAAEIAFLPPMSGG